MPSVCSGLAIGFPIAARGAALLAAAMCVCAGQARTIVVPDDIDNLSDAFEAAPDGGTIVIDGGTHTLLDPVRVDGKSVTVRGQNGAVIDGSLLDGASPMLRVVGRADAGGRGTIVIEGLTFAHGANTTGTIGGDGAMGGAVLAERSDLTLRGCSFRRNSAASGGAVGMVGPGALRIEGSAFDDNAAARHGGAVVTVDGSRVEIVGSVFTGNAAGGSGGAVAVEGRGADVVASGSRFIGNTAAVDGGAVLIADHVRVFVANSVFAGNDAGEHGGAIARRGGELVIDQNSFTGNTATFGGAIATDGGGRMVLRSVTSIRNRALRGGDVFAGGSVLITGSSSIFWSDTESGGHPITGEAAVTARLSHALVRGGWDGFGHNNIDANPMLADVVGPDGVDGTGDEDLRPRAGSPVVDTGEPGVETPWSGDLSGRGRTASDRGFGYRALDERAERRIDIGAFEHQRGELAWSPVDLVEPFGAVDGEDLRAALDLLQAGDARVDFVVPFGVVDAADAVEVIGQLAELIR